MHSKRMQILHGYSAVDGKKIWKTRIAELNISVITKTDMGGRARLTYQVPEDNIVDHFSASISFGSESDCDLFQVVEQMFRNRNRKY